MDVLNEKELEQVSGGHAKAARSYQIKKGETLYSIAKQFGTTVETLCKLNGFLGVPKLNFGEFIRIP